MRNYEATIAKLKAEGLITDTDKYVFGRYDQKITFGAMLGAVGGLMTIRWSDVDYLVAVNDNSVSVFFIDKKTGDYVGKHIKLTREQVNKFLCKRYLFGNRRIILRSKQAKIAMNFFTCDTFRGFNQSENKNAFTDFVRTYW